MVHAWRVARVLVAASRLWTRSGPVVGCWLSRPFYGQGLAGPWHASGQGHAIGPCLQVFPHFGGGGATSRCMLGASRRLYSASRFGTRAAPSFAAGSPAHLWAGPGWVMACVWARAALAVRGAARPGSTPPFPLPCRAARLATPPCRAQQSATHGFFFLRRPRPFSGMVPPVSASRSK